MFKSGWKYDHNQSGRKYDHIQSGRKYDHKVAGSTTRVLKKNEEGKFHVYSSLLNSFLRLIFLRRKSLAWARKIKWLTVYKVHLKDKYKEVSSSVFIVY